MKRYIKAFPLFFYRVLKAESLSTPDSYKLLLAPDIETPDCDTVIYRQYLCHGYGRSGTDLINIVIFWDDKWWEGSTILAKPDHTISLVVKLIADGNGAYLYNHLVDLTRESLAAP